MAAAVVAPAMDDSGDGSSPTRRVLFTCKQLDKLGVRLPCAFARTGLLSCYIQVCT